jgi:hypothetical protein
MSATPIAKVGGCAVEHPQSRRLRHCRLPGLDARAKRDRRRPLSGRHGLTNPLR